MLEVNFKYIWNIFDVNSSSLAAADRRSPAASLSMVKLGSRKLSQWISIKLIHSFTPAAFSLKV